MVTAPPTKYKLRGNGALGFCALVALSATALPMADKPTARAVQRGGDQLGAVWGRAVRSREAVRGFGATIGRLVRGRPGRSGAASLGAGGWLSGFLAGCSPGEWEASTRFGGAGGGASVGAGAATVALVL